MIAPATEAEILRLFHAEHWPKGTIAAQLGVHHDSVERVLADEGQARVRLVRPSILEPFLPLIHETLARYPKIRASRLHAMCVERGYRGAPDHFRHKIQGLRPRPAAEAFLRLRTLPGEQAQVDWGHFGHVAIGRAQRQLMAFVMVLSYSRMVFLRFFFGSPMECFVRGHLAAFEAFQGVGRVLLYDNLKSAVLERRGDAIRFHPKLLELAKHYRFEPRPVAVARGNEKGRVERAIRYVRDSFFAARVWRDLSDLNAQAQQWCQGMAADRPCPQDRSITVRAAFQEERERLIALPPAAFPATRIEEVKVGKQPYVRFDLNDYSVPHDRTRRILTVVADEDAVRVVEGTEVLAQHARSYDKGAQIEDPAHIEALVDDKRHARKARASDRLVRSVPSTAKLLDELARRGANMGSACNRLLLLLDEYGKERMELAVREALSRQTPEPRSVRLVLDRMSLEEGRGPRVPLHLPDDPRVRDVVVRPHSLDSYGVLGRSAQEVDDVQAS